MRLRRVVQAAAEHGDALAAGLQGGDMGGPVDAHGEPGDHGDASLGEAGRDARSEVASLPGRVARAHDGDEPRFGEAGA